MDRSGDHENRKLNWRRFRLYCALTFTGLLIASTGMVVFPIVRALKQAHAVGNIRKLGGVVLYDFEYDFTLRNGCTLEWKRKPTPHVLLRGLLGDDLLGDVVYVQINSGQLNDVTIERLRLEQLQGLRHLDLSGSQLSDASIPYLANLTQLKILNLNQTNVTPRALSGLRQDLPSCIIRGP